MATYRIASVLGAACLMICALAQAQNTPSSPSTSNPSMANPAPSNPSDSTSSTSPPSPGHKDKSRSAKEQQSQKHKCPKSGDNSNVNCKERGQADQSPK